MRYRLLKSRVPAKMVVPYWRIRLCLVLQGVKIAKYREILLEESYQNNFQASCLSYRLCVLI